ncbi:hypothetical protein TorRG33x02_312720 [Trema orientale]|uniref:Transmembrane protein n=1 Tax=Trema orientale TaxID=63057 RepID=A0A2P5BQ48_TREOI|nr:hypothetical protein TorRG33x02_312720 [Trema orientale]
MHLWPSTKLRDSFKFPYVRNLDRKMSQMKAQKKASAALEQGLLEGEGDGGASVNGKLPETSQNPEPQTGFFHICKILLVIFTCGCFCGGPGTVLLTGFVI